MDSHPESPPSRREQELAEELNEVARARFGDKVGPVVVAHLNLQGVDCESDLRCPTRLESLSLSLSHTHTQTHTRARKA